MIGAGLAEVVAVAGGVLKALRSIFPDIVLGTSGTISTSLTIQTVSSTQLNSTWLTTRISSAQLFFLNTQHEYSPWIFISSQLCFTEQDKFFGSQCAACNKQEQLSLALNFINIQ